MPKPRIQRKRKDASARFGKYSMTLLVCTGLAIVALVVMYVFDGPGQFRNFIATIPSSIEAILREKPRLLVEAQNGLANEPLPLGVAVEHASGGEIVTIEGLPEGGRPVAREAVGRYWLERTRRRSGADLSRRAGELRRRD